MTPNAAIALTASATLAYAVISFLALIVAGATLWVALRAVSEWRNQVRYGHKYSFCLELEATVREVFALFREARHPMVRTTDFVPSGLQSGLTSDFELWEHVFNTRWARLDSAQKRLANLYGKAEAILGHSVARELSLLVDSMPALRASQTAYVNDLRHFPIYDDMDFAGKKKRHALKSAALGFDFNDSTSVGVKNSSQEIIKGIRTARESAAQPDREPDELD